ncbi:MAG: hypothetical protein JOZ07_01045 [Solirubrobacterales bacterium]|nr:hypothetical protein [Solirubrobacterales bacterium]
MEPVRTAPPAGYLGAEGRITSGPAPAMEIAGYGYEIADAEFLHEALGIAHLAHVTMLAEQGVIPAADRGPLVRGVLRMIEIPVDEFPYERQLGDAYNSQEKWLEAEIGAAAGWLSAGRTRREAGRLAFRLVLRDALVGLGRATAAFADSLTAVAQRHAQTLAPDYTYLQIAQATTFGHYLLSFSYPALRDCDRIRAALSWVDRSPGGVGGVAGSRLPLDRRRIAELLAFAGVIEHARDAMWQTDGLVDTCGAAVNATTNCARLAQDLEIYASSEFGIVQLASDVSRASALMPQKRNPYSLPVIRGAAGLVLGRLTGVAAMQQTPSARTDNLLYAYREVLGAVRTAGEVVDLAATVVRGLTISQARLRELAHTGFAQATDVTEALCRNGAMDYRSAYRVVARAAAIAVDEGLADLTHDALRQASEEVLGEPCALLAGELDELLDPRAAVDSRTIEGGAAAGPLRDMVRACGERCAEATAGFAADARRYEAMPAALRAAAAAVCG